MLYGILTCDHLQICVLSFWRVLEVSPFFIVYTFIVCPGVWFLPLPVLLAAETTFPTWKNRSSVWEVLF